MTAGNLKEWLNTLPSGKDLPLPGGLPDDLEGLKSAVNINALADWFTVGDVLTEIDPDAGNLCLSGAIATGTPLISLWFFTADDSESDDAEIAGVQIALSLKGHPVMAFLDDIGLQDLLLVYEIRMMDGATVREVYAQADVPVQGGESLLITCAFDFAAGQKSFEFIVEPEPGKESHVLQAFFGLFGLAPPPFLKDVALERLMLAYDKDTGTTGFRVEVDARFPLGEVSAALAVKVALTKQSGGQGYDQEYTGRLLLEAPAQSGDEDEPTRLWFSGAVSKEASGAWELSASLENHGQDLGLAHLAGAVGIDIPADLDPLVPAFNSASVTYRFPVAPSTPGSMVVSLAMGRVGLVVASVPAEVPGAVARLVAVRGAVGARASDLPLVGESIPADRDLVATGVQFLYADRALPVNQVRALNTVIAGLPGSEQGLLPVLLEEPLQRGLLVWASLTLGTEKLPPLVLRPRNTGAPALPQGEAAETPPPGTVVLGRERSDSAVAVDRVYGPVRIHRVSLGYAGGRVFVAFDATLTMGPVALDLIGLGLGVDQKFSVTPVLAGAGVRVDVPPLDVSGVLEVREESGYEVFIAGHVAVEAGFFAMQAAGSYARTTGGVSSLFLFGEIGAKGGVALFGPPAFSVTALSGGFGVNSTVRVPQISELPEFPLIDRLAGAEEATPQQILDKLTEWVRPADGQYWGAVGVQFTTFKFIDTKALALVEFGRSLNVMLLGRTSVTFPRNATPGTKVHARLDIDLKLAYQQAQGLLSLDVAVGPGSFVFDPACQLTGGIAVYVWTAGERAGDFVLTAGGYHPRYKVPAHYPRPARLGFVWSPDSKIMVKAEVYTALTPSAFMIGGRLSATYSSGLLSAWFTAYLDVLIQWKPFYLDMALGISIGVAFTIKVWFVKVRVSIEVGIDLALWTPPFGGRVTVKVWFISFSFDIGSRRVPLPSAAWPEIRAQLPAPLAITPQQGLLADVDAGELAARRAVGAPTLVSRDGFVFTTESAVPATRIYLNDVLIGRPESSISVRPMRRTGVTSEHRVTLKRNGGAFTPVNWTVSVVRKDAARALWGAPLAKPGDALNEDALLRGQLAGLRFEVPGPEEGPRTGPVTSEALSTEQLDPDGVCPARPGQSAGPAPVPASGSVRIIEETIAARQPKRDAAYAAMVRLGVAPGANGPRDRYAAKAADILVRPPLLTAAN
ncbi:DUF6603 domain-containing protein [Streptomyces decoyicus]|uniref:DUF6603 domain-containing protein n=1 Tax=Streptomyces decoyicus TaxID=249567 RepID=UPI00364B94BB